METTDEKKTTPEINKPKRTFKKLFLSTLLLLLISASSIYLLKLSLDNEKKWSSYNQQKVDSLLILYKTNISKYDSVSSELSKYLEHKALYNGMTSRDNVVKLLKYKYSDVVYCKPDSTKVTITEVIIGGSGYNYYVKYKVKIGLTGIPFELEPDQIY